MSDWATVTEAQRKGMMSSATPEWATPPSFFAEIAETFPFELDVCATPQNAKCDRFFTREQDGLAQPWEGVCWCNPPYGREIGKWVAKAYESAQSGKALVVMLLPARTDTAWWHRYCMKAAELWFVKGRIQFWGATTDNAPFPSVVVVFTKKGSTSPRISTFSPSHGQTALEIA